jgi:hypothetical protein
MVRKSAPSSPTGDKQASHVGKVENEHNKLGHQKPTQKNEGRRTPLSRHDRESHIGGENQTQERSARNKGRI